MLLLMQLSPPCLRDTIYSARVKLRAQARSPETLGKWIY